MLWTALLFGLASSGHCIVMCGPLVAVMQGGRKTWHFLLYHAGRISSYVVLGMFFGIIGRVVSLTAFQQSISIISGVIVLLVAGLVYLPFNRGKYGMSSAHRLLTRLFQKLKPLPVSAAIPARGALNGLLPCGMVYLAAAAAIQGGAVWFGIAYMLLFGLGTIPVMFAASFLEKATVTNLRNFRFRTIFIKAGPYLAILIACLFILRGLAMDIPYLSPKITINANHHVQSCCEKK